MATRLSNHIVSRNKQTQRLPERRSQKNAINNFTASNKTFAFVQFRHVGPRPCSGLREKCGLAGLLAVIVALLFSPGCKPIQVNNVRERLIPTNDRLWNADMTKLATAEFSGSDVMVHNIRNCEYATEEDYVVEYSDRKFRLDDLQTVDFIVVPFKNKLIAHTMLSFGLRDGAYICVSVEIRRELGEAYSTILGMSNQYELIYLVAEERDLIRLRTRYRDAEVYVYPTVATPESAQKLFIDVFERANHLAVRPEFYHTVVNNCTTNIVSHVNDLKPNRVPFNWKVLLPGYSAEYAYELGLLDNRLPFDELKRLAYVNDLADEHFDDPDFSQLIRQRHEEIKRVIAENREVIAARTRNESRRGRESFPVEQFSMLNDVDRKRLPTP